MTTTQWIISVIAALVGGGAMGAIINSIVTRYRSGRQPVGRLLYQLPIFRRNPEFPSLRAILMDESSEGSESGIAVENLYVAVLTVENSGNQDIEEFKLGVTLADGDKAIDIKTETLDRHHVMRLDTPVTLNSPLTELDFTLIPFNRKEPYTVNIYFIPGEKGRLSRFCVSGDNQPFSLERRPDYATDQTRTARRTAEGLQEAG